MNPLLYLALKFLHLLCAATFLGGGAAAAWARWHSDRSGDLRVIAHAQRQIVLYDWLFTVPAGLLLPATGLGLVHLAGLPLWSSFAGVGLIAWAVAGACWLPAARLQLRMRHEAEAALAEQRPLSEHYHRAARRWLWLGVPAFVAALWAVWAMVSRRAPF